MNQLEQRLEQVLDAYGASPDRWPEEERSVLLALIERSARARERLDAAARLDGWLDAAPPTRAPSPDLAQRILDATSQGSAPSRRNTWRWATVLPVAAAAAFALWVTRVPAPTPVPEQTVQIAIADLGIYTTPTDILLEVDGFDPLESVPSYDCQESELGCFELDPDSGWPQQQSMQGGTRRMKT